MDKDNKKRAVAVGSTLLAVSMMFSSGCSVAHAEGKDDQDIACIYYVVEKGDTLSEISQRYYNNSCHYKELAVLNNIKNPNLIRVGDVIKVPNDLSDLLEYCYDIKDDEVVYYTIQKGDTLTSICRKFNISSEYIYHLATYNNLYDPDIIVTGETLEIPAINVLKKVRVDDYSYLDKDDCHKHDHRHHFNPFHKHRRVGSVEEEMLEIYDCVNGETVGYTRKLK